MRSVGPLLTVLCAVACAPDVETPVRAPVEARDIHMSRGPRIVVAVVIDQLSMWELTERLPKLPPGGGLTRLAREADVASELRYGYVQTSTAIGHAALFTGLTPRDSRILSNEVLDDTGAPRAIVRDDRTRLVGRDGPMRDRSGVSLAALAPDRETFADALGRQRPDVTVACVSLKDRGAVFSCGRSPDAVVWFDWKSDAFVTSTAFAERFPALAAGFDAPGIGAAYRQMPWEPRDPTWLASVAPSQRADVEQGDFEGLGRAFPHRFEGLGRPERAMLATPLGDTLTVDLALAMIDRLPRDRDAYLAVSLSAHDYVNHVFTAGAPESFEALRAVDGELARLYEKLDAVYGPDRYAIVLSSDHGGPPAQDAASRARCASGDADRFERPCVPFVRLYEDDLTERAREAAAGALGPGDWILGTSEPFVRFTAKARALDSDRRAKLVAAAIAALDALPGVARVVDASSAPADCPAEADESLDALICRSLPPHGEPGLLIVPERGAFFDTGYTPGDGCNHGTPYLFDRAVPFFVKRFGRPGAQAAGRSFDPSARVTPAAYSRALAELLEVEPPRAL